MHGQSWYQRQTCWTLSHQRTATSISATSGPTLSWATCDGCGQSPTRWAHASLDFSSVAILAWHGDGRAGCQQFCAVYTIKRRVMLQAYFDYLDHTGGFFYERWGDAPVHSLAAVMLLNATEVLQHFHGSLQRLTAQALHNTVLTGWPDQQLPPWCGAGAPLWGHRLPAQQLHQLPGGEAQKLRLRRRQVGGPARAAQLVWALPRAVDPPDEGKTGGPPLHSMMAEAAHQRHK
jgi:Glycolipid 2-alpha-mannosyltransferase